MLADDESIVIDSLSYMIEKNFGQTCEIKAAKSGRKVIELAEEFQPDIAFMDIQMPGINGIEAMKEIRKRNEKIIFIVMTAYDRFSFAQESINLGVMEYLTKPSNKEKVISTLERAMELVNDMKKKRMEDLEMKEKLGTIIPVLESNLVYSILFQTNDFSNRRNLKQLLNIQKDYGYIMVLEFGERKENGQMSNPIGSSVKATQFYTQFREIIQEFFQGVIGPIMGNRMIIVVFREEAAVSLEERSKMIETSRDLIRKMKKRTDIQFKIGIGSCTNFEGLRESFEEAVEVLRINSEKVGHVQDLPIGCQYEEDYPIHLEKELFDAVKKGDVGRVRLKAEHFFNWMEGKYQEDLENIKLKVLEFVLYAEHLSYESGGRVYHFQDRFGYLDRVQKMASYQEILSWFVEKITDACMSLNRKKEDQSNAIIKKAKEYINQRFMKDISLDEVSREVDISSYYFSKLFKGETGENFIEYLTRIRMDKARELLQSKEFSIKQICVLVGYSDPNYFSRIFKKSIGITPTEYREKEEER